MILRSTLGNIGGVYFRRFVRALIDNQSQRYMPVQALVVDDDITIRTMVVLQLDKLGVKSDSAYNGIEALRRVHAWHYSLILMDISMPDMDGYEATAAIRSYEKKHGLKPTPIVGVSALCEDDEAAAQAAGMNACYRKPVLMEHLQEIVAKYLAPFDGDRHRTA